MYSSKVCGLKYYRKLDLYKSSNSNLIIDLKTGVATSYKWWNFSMKSPLDPNTILFNIYSYSITTSGHQRKAERFFREKGFRIEYINLGSKSTSLLNLLEYGPVSHIDSIAKLHVEMNRRGSKKSTNEQRKVEIQWHVGKLERLVELGCIVNLDNIETLIAWDLSEESDRILTKQEMSL